MLPSKLTADYPPRAAVVGKLLEVMITGYNTDVEYGGVVYHVQTEDKGLEKPVILSLVYVGGEILASKRSPYEDLIQSGFSEAILVERLQRQHKLICAAIHTGRIDELKRMSQREQAAESPQIREPVVADTPVPAEAPRPPLPPAWKPSLRSRTRISVSAPAEDADALQIKLIDEPPLRAGESIALRLMIYKGSADKQAPKKKARVSARILGSTFSPVKATATTNKDGIAEINIKIPEFTAGRGAILIRAEADKEVAELRRVIQPVRLKK